MRAVKATGHILSGQPMIEAPIIDLATERLRRDPDGLKAEWRGILARAYAAYVLGAEYAAMLDRGAASFEEIAQRLEEAAHIIR